MAGLVARRPRATPRIHGSPKPDRIWNRNRTITHVMTSGAAVSKPMTMVRPIDLKSLGLLDVGVRGVGPVLAEAARPRHAASVARP
jgi:hypothetical protein